MRHGRLLVLFGLLAAVAAPAWAAEVEGHHPPCGAPGDLVYVQGTGFARRPAVTFAGVRAEVVRTRAGVLLCRVPEGLAEGPVELRVGGAAAPLAFKALAAGRPVVHGLSATVGTHGQAVIAHGRRLHRGRVAFVDRESRTAARIEVVGGRRAVSFLVPETLAPGPYAVVFTNGEGLSTGVCSPRFDVVRDREPELGAIHPAGAVPSASAAPGQVIRCLGTDLGPPGPCRVHWKDRQGVSAESGGRSNGYDAVLTSVPGVWVGGEPCEVRIELGSGVLTPPLTWTPAKRVDPAEVTVAPSAGPAGCYVAVRGTGLSARPGDVRAALSSAHATAEVDVVFRHPGGLGHGAAWMLRMPEGLAEGDYDLTLRIGDRVAPALAFRVAEQPLAVTGLWPTRPPRAGTDLPTRIEGAGFGTRAAADDLRVVWTNGTRTREGTVVFRSDRVLRVLPLTAYSGGSQPESWSVYVLRGRGAGTRAVKAGAVFCGDG